MYTDKYISHFSSVKLLRAADRDNCRKMQVVKIQRKLTACGVVPIATSTENTNEDWKAVNAKGPGYLLENFFSTYDGEAASMKSQQ